MSSVLDSSVLIDHLRGNDGAREVVAEARRTGVVHASEITRLEILVGMRDHEAAVTRNLLSSIRWLPVDREVAEKAGELGRRWLPSHRGIDSSDLAIAATAMLLGATLLTLNVRHFPMFPGLRRPY